MIDPALQRHPSPSVPNSNHPEPGYDTSRISVAGIYWFILCFIGTMAMLLALVWFTQLHFEKRQQSQITSPIGPSAPLALSQPLQPSPDHPTLDWQDLAALRNKQEEQLNSTGPLPGDPAHAHIPINQAIDQLLNSGELNRPWQNPATLPFQRPATEPALPPVENRT